MAYRNPRPFTTARRPGPMHGTATPMRFCYAYTPASPVSTRTAPLDLCAQPPADSMRLHKPLYPNSSPVTRSLPENPTSDLALPSLEHLVNALHAIAARGEAGANRRHKHSASDRPGRLPSCERRSSHRERRLSRDARSRDRRSRERHSAHHHLTAAAPEHEAEHVPASAWMFETSSPKTPKRKLHYVPATPSLYSPQSVLKQVSPVALKNELPTPPPSNASSSPKSFPLSPPKRHYTPAPTPGPSPAPVLAIEYPVPTCESPTPSASASDIATSKLTRFALACRETVADDAAIEALMDSFDSIMDSLVDRSDCGSELSID